MPGVDQVIVLGGHDYTWDPENRGGLRLAPLVSDLLACGPVGPGALLVDSDTFLIER
ncbi:hypothetical protein GGP85_002876 [Salinibacter ruber]|nr:hypothetical protein [Salinibacter ruber]MCS3627711.1 hypothetical protein [Salinibacter ruber]MCS3827406.1 hypothetical protein [Salinibacter ruber]MCS4144620.1 hypothetical protein [Salinibacter ruber]